MAFSDCNSVLMRNPTVAVQGLFASKANQIQTLGSRSPKKRRFTLTLASFCLHHALPVFSTNAPLHQPRRELPGTSPVVIMFSVFFCTPTLYLYAPII